MSVEDNTQSAPATEATSSEPVSDFRAAFAAAEKELAAQETAETESTKEPEVEAVDEPEEGKQEQEASEVSPLNAPISWSGKAKEVFATLPREAQETILEREAQRDRGLQEKFQEIKQAERMLEPYAEISEVVQPYMREWKLSGQTPAQVIGRVLETQAFLDSDPINAFRWLASTYKLTPQEIFSEGTDFNDPTFLKQKEIQERLERLEELERNVLNAQQQQQGQTAEREVQLFASQKDTQGNLMYPFFKEVESDMGPIAVLLLQQNPNEDIQRILHEAYDRAVYANPNTRGRVMTQKAREEQAKRVQEAKAKSDQAKRAGSTLRSNGSTVANASNGTLRDILSDAYDQIVGS